MRILRSIAAIPVFALIAVFVGSISQAQTDPPHNFLFSGGHLTGTTIITVAEGGLRASGSIDFEEEVILTITNNNPDVVGLSYNSLNPIITMTVVTIDRPPHFQSGGMFFTATADETVDDENYEIVFAWRRPTSTSNTASVTLTGTVTDDEATSAGVTLNPTSILTNIAEGESTTFTAVLAAQPSRDVVLTLTSSDTDVATVDDANVTFTNSNWNEAQTVSISGVDKNGIQPAMPYTVTIAVDSGPGAYGTLAAQELSGNIRDKDSPNLILNPLSDLASIDEESGETTFTVVLDTQPTSGNVVIDLTSSDTAIATVVPAQLTFDAGNWNRVQTGTVTAVDNDTIGDGQNYIITVAVDDANSSNEYDSLSERLSGEVTEDDSAGFTLDPSDTLIGPTENEGAIRLTIVLDAQPVSDVVLSIATSDPEIGFAVSTLFTFTPMNWDTSQNAFILTGRSDRIVQLPVDYTVTVGVVAASSDDDFDDVPDQVISGTLLDNDIPNLILLDTFSTVVSPLTEGGGGRNIRMGIDAQAIPPVGIDVIVSVTTDSDEVVLSGVTLATINSTNIGDTRRVLITPVDDDLVDGSQSYTLTASVVRVDGGPSAYDTTISTTATGVINDNDLASVLVDATNLPNSETNGYFVVSLPKGPLTNVVLDVTSSGEGLNPITPLSATKLTFTGGSTGNWNTAQTIMVTAEVDFNVNADETYTITVSVDEDNSDDAFDSVPDNLILGTILDDDVGEFTLSPTTLGTIAEGGSTSFTVVLDAQPRINVVLTLTMSGKPVSLSAATLTFTSGNWNNGQTIMVEGVDNSDMDGDLPFTITVDVDTAASDVDFNLAPILEVSGFVSDDEVPGFKLLPLGGASALAAIDENSGETTFTVVLNTNPDSGDVVIDVTSSDTAIATVVPAELTFTADPSGNWNTEQTVTVTAVDDSIVSDRNYIITVAVDGARSSDDYDSVANQELSGTVPDDGEPALTPTWPTFPESVTEGEVGEALTGQQPYTIGILDTGSGEGISVVISPTIDDSNGGFHFQQSDYTVALDDSFLGIFGVFRLDNDLLDVTPIINTIVITMTSNDPLYDGEEFSQPITVLDNDLHASISISAASFTEGESGTFTVAIPAEQMGTSGEFFGGPVTDVVTTISISGLDAADYTLTPASALLTFAGGGTTGLWRAAQTVSLNVARDGTVSSPARDIGIHVAVIEDESDAIFYEALTDLDYVQSASVSEVDVAGFTLLPAPATGLGTIAEGGASTSFTAVLDASPSSGNVVLTLITTGKTVSLSATTLTFTATNWDEEQTIMVSGEDNDIPDSDLAYTITVGVDAAASNDAFNSVVNQELSGTVSDDDVPGIQVNPPVNLASISEDSGQTTFTVVLNTLPTSGNVVIDLTSSDPAIATVVPAELTFTGGPTSNWNTAQTGTVTAVDDDTIGADENYAVTVAVDDANSSSEYASISSTLSGVVTEDDMADLIFNPSTLADITEGGDPTTFTVRLSAQPTMNVTFDVTSSAPDATVVPAELTFTGGDSGNYGDEQRITVTPRVDNEESQSDVAYTITFTATSGDGDFNGITPELQGTVRDDDGLSEEQTEVAIASADTFGTAQIATDLISGHLLAPPAVQPQAQLAGIALGSTTNLPVHSDLEQDPWGNDEDNAWQNDIADLIPGTEFTLPLSDTDSRGGHYEIWGAAGYSDLSGDPTSDGEKTEYDGKATGVHIGIGRRYVNGTSFGVSIGSTKVELDIDLGSGDPVKVERDLISIHPYIGWTLQDGLAAWLIAGYGDGDYEQDDEQTDASLLMLGGGVQRSWSVNGNDVAVRLEGVTTESKLDTKGNLTGESSAWQGRVEFEIARSFAAAGGGHVQPYGTFGYRYDGGDLGGSGAGEVGLGLRSQLAASWTIDVKSRFQVTDSDHERRSIQGHVKYDRDTDRRGWLFTLSNSFEYEVEDADTAAEYTRVLEGSVGYGWSRTLLSQRGTLDLHLKASRGDEQEEPVIGFGFTAPLLRLGLDGSEEEVELYFNYVYTDF